MCTTLAFGQDITYQESCIDTMLQKVNSFYQKYRFTKMALDINGTSQKWLLTILNNAQYFVCEVGPFSSMPNSRGFRFIF